MTGRPSWNSIRKGALYSGIAADLGYEFGRGHKFGKGGRSYVTAIAQDFFDFYGVEFLRKLGTKLQPDGSPLRIALNPQFSHPLLHVLLQFFFDRQRESKQGHEAHLQRNVIADRIRCPNPYAQHSDDFRITHIVRRKSSGGKYFRARCACGYAFAFRTMSDRDQTMPVVVRHVAYGETFEKEARRLYEEHPSITFVAETMSIDFVTAKRLLEGEKSKFERTDAQILGLREEWLETRSRKAYVSLLEWDRDWLLANTTRRKSSVAEPKEHDCRSERPSKH
jgi:hypothetical protein